MELNLTVKQSQTLSPQMIQSMKVLQMGSQELMEFISEVAQENPVLEASEQKETEFTALRKKLEWLESTDRQDRYYQKQDSEQENDPLIHYGGVEAREENLYYDLKSQVQALELPADVTAAVRLIVESLNGRGYLDDSLEELAEDFRLDLPLLERALTVVQSLEPAGIGARSLGECLILQLRRLPGDTTLAQTIAEQHLNALARNRYPLIARALGAEVEQVREACELIRTLNPKPGTGFSDREQPSYIVPDLFVDAFSDHFELSANDEFFPTLKLSSYYKGLMTETQDEEVKEYLTSKVRQAKWVVKSIEQRRSTLMSCAECILEKQEPFFHWGRGHLVPMSLNDVAETLGIHESTVSRAIRGKYIQCRHGVYPLSYFFSRSLGGEAADGGLSTPDAAKNLLKKLVSEEDKRKPLSDQKLCTMMAEQGCQISRRTVAKYRDELGIASTAGRKSYD